MTVLLDHDDNDILPNLFAISGQRWLLLTLHSARSHVRACWFIRENNYLVDCTVSIVDDCISTNVSDLSSVVRNDIITTVATNILQ